MANEIKLKRSSVAGKAPTTSDLALGELAVNTYDGKLYTKKNDGTDAIVEFAPAAGPFLAKDSNDSTSGAYNFTNTATTAKISYTGHGGANSYNYMFNARNDTGVKVVAFLNGSTRTDDGGVNAFTLRNDFGKNRFGSSSHNTIINGDKVGFNIENPLTPYHFQGETDDTQLRVSTSNTAAQTAIFAMNPSGKVAGPLAYGSTRTPYGALLPDQVGYYSNTHATIMADGATSTLKFATGGNTERMSIQASGNLRLGNDSTIQDVARLNICSTGSDETRAIDIDGQWLEGESKSISFIYGDNSSNFLGQINCQYINDAGRLRWGKLYDAGNTSSYPMMLTARDATHANLTVMGDIGVGTNSPNSDSTNAGRTLQVSGATWARMQLTSQGMGGRTYGWYTNTDGKFSIYDYDAGAFRWHLNSNGNVEQSGNLTVNGEIYAEKWIRSQNAGQGLYNQTTQSHFYSPGSTYWHINPQAGSTSGGLVFYGNYNATQGDAANRKGYVYWDANGFGLLGKDATWGVNVSDDGKNIVLGGHQTLNQYNSTPSVRLSFGGGNDMNNYSIGTSLEDFNGNYTKLDIRWHTGIRVGAQKTYGGIRFYDSEDFGSVLLSIGKTDTNTRLEGGDFHVISSNIGSGGTTAFNSMTGMIRWDELNTYSDSARGPNRLVTQASPAWIAGLGIHSSTQAYYSGEKHSFYRGTNATTFTHQMTIDGGGNVTATGNVTAYSDVSLKENIEVIPDAIAKVSAIRGVTYDRKDMEGARHAGVIAQEVEAVLPEVVSTDEEGVKSVAYGNLVGLLVEAVKELTERVEELEARLES